MTEAERIRVKEFADCARRYMAWVTAPAVSSSEDMESAQKLLTELHFRRLSLPDSLGDLDSELPDLEATPASKLMESLEKLPIDMYWDVVDFLKTEPDEPCRGSLRDDLADIYRDLYEPLRYWEMGKAPDAVFGWRMSCDTHWGQHLVDAQRIIHAYFLSSHFVP